MEGQMEGSEMAKILLKKVPLTSEDLSEQEYGKLVVSIPSQSVDCSG
jgi:hypothetical protein